MSIGKCEQVPRFCKCKKVTTYEQVWRFLHMTKREDMGDIPPGNVKRSQGL